MVNGWRINASGWAFKVKRCKKKRDRAAALAEENALFQPAIRTDFFGHTEYLACIELEMVMNEQAESEFSLSQESLGRGGGKD